MRLRSRIAELERGSGRDLRVDQHIEQVRTALGGPPAGEADARRLVELLAVTWTASLLVQHGEPDVTGTYLRSRLDGEWGREFGTLPSDAPLNRIAARAVPLN